MVEEKLVLQFTFLSLPVLIKLLAYTNVQKLVKRKINRIIFRKSRIHDYV